MDEPCDEHRVANCAQCEYKRLGHVEHILLRPDTYVGSVEAVTQSMWVFDYKVVSSKEPHRRKIALYM